MRWIPLVMLAFATNANAAEPRLQWVGDGVRYLNAYGGKWVSETTGKKAILKEIERNAERIVLSDDEKKTIVLTAVTLTIDGKKTAGKWVAERADSDLGFLSEKYESGGRGPGVVSTGVGDPGGVSYGTYQLASKIGRADQFTNKYYAVEFAGLKGGSDAFTAKWKALAAKDADALHKNEHQFIQDTHYEPQLRKLKKELGLDVGKRSPVFRDAVWSSAVHHGPNTDAIIVAIQPLVRAKVFDEVAALKAIYAERGRKNADGKLVRFKNVGESWIPGLTKRFENELRDALAALEVKE